MDDKGVHEEAVGKIAEYVAGIPIYELCTGADPMDGSSRLLRWWDQYHGPNQMEREVE